MCENYLRSKWLISLASKMSEDGLLQHFQTEFKTEEELRFLKHFRSYFTSKTKNKFHLDLDDIIDWIGFTSKGNAKRHLHSKYYTENVDFIIVNNGTSNGHGGHNKEQIFVTATCFKAMCMFSNTEKGKASRLYFIKLEEMLFEYFEKHYHYDLDRVSAREAELRSEQITQAEKEKENLLKEKYKRTSLVYILRISKDSVKVKIGQTNDINTRLRDLHARFPNSVLIDVFPCVRSHEFEQYLLKRPDIRKLRCPVSEGLGQEVIAFTDRFTYKELLSIIKKNIGMFNNYEGLRLEKEVLLLQLLREAPSEEDRQLYRNMLQREGYEIPTMDSSNNLIPESHRKVFKYDPTNLKDYIEVFPNLREAARSLNNIGYRDYHIREAAQSSTLFAGFRWYYVDNDEDAPDSIPETVTPLIEPKAQTAFHVAQLSLDKIKVVNIYGAVCKAAEAVSSPACSICTAITRGTALKKFYWSKYDDLPDELKQTYTDPLPPLFKQVTCSKFVEKIDPLTDRVVEVLDTMQEVNAKYKISHKKLNDLTSSGDIYKGFKWRVVSKKANDAVKQDEQATVEDFIEQELPSETNACNVQQPNTPISNIEPVLPKTRKPSSAAQKVFKCSDSKAIIAVYATLKEAREAHDFKYSETEIRKVAKDCTILDGFRWVLSHEKVPEIPDTASTTKSHTKTYDHFAIVDHSTKEVLNVFASQKEVAEYLGISPALANKRFQDQNPIKGKQIWAWDKLPTPSKEAYLQKGGTLPIRKSAQSKSIIRIDPNTQEEHIYASIIDATDTLKVARRDILNAIKTNTSFHGYNWKWVQA